MSLSKVRAGVNTIPTGSMIVRGVKRLTLAAEHPGLMWLMEQVRNGRGTHSYNYDTEEWVVHIKLTDIERYRGPGLCEADEVWLVFKEEESEDGQN